MLTREETTAAVLAMKELIPHCPQTPVGQAMVVDFLRGFVDTSEHLEWLTKTACRKMTNFSMPSLRGLYCTRFKPADGLPDDICDVPGFTPADLEMRAVESVKAEEQLKIAQWKREQKLLTGSDVPEKWEPSEQLKQLPQLHSRRMKW